MSPVLATGTPALWYATRGSGAVALALLSLSVVLGILEVHRWSAAGAPRFMVAALHRSTSLLVLAFLAVHVLTAVLDSFAPIRLLDAVVPFGATYRPLWVGLGALALDALLAVLVTSLVRRRLGLRAWRAVHWAAYACWPVAMAHALGTGSDVRARWLAALAAACGAAVGGAVAWRLARSRRAHPRVAVAGATAVAAALLAVALWLPQGPLAPGWARRSGTPASLLAFHAAPVRAAPARGAGAAPRAARPAPRRRPDRLASGFSGALHGTLRQGVSRGGTTVVDLRLHARGAEVGIRMGGRPAAGGGLALRASAVTAGPPSAPGRYRGRISRLDGGILFADVASPDGRAMRLELRLRLDSTHVTGTVVARPLGRAGA
jgi:ferric reductase like protein